MRNVTKPLRQAYIAALNGQLTLDGENVPVVDGWDRAQGLNSAHVIISTVGDNEGGNTFVSWVYDVVVNLDIITYQRNGFTSEGVEDIEDQILQILFPTVSTTPISIAGAQVRDVYKQGATDGPNEENESGVIVRKQLRIQQTIIQS